MQTVLVFNPVSGKGKAQANVEAVSRALQTAGHTTTLVETQRSDSKSWLLPKLADCDLLIVCGGDGTVLLVLDSVLESGVPIYHMPEGTENLFARGFGMSAQPDKVVAAVNRFRQVKVDVGQANGQRFLLMASLGFDAEVVHDLAVRRAGSISHLSYIRPMLRQLFRWRPPPLRVVIDGRDLLDVHAAPSLSDFEEQVNGQVSMQSSTRRGFVIVANSRCYALGLNPAPQASIQDGQLDVVFVPVRRAWHVLWWLLLLLCGRFQHSRRISVGQGRVIEISAASRQRFQLDGDPAEDVANVDCDGPWQLSVTVKHGQLSVIVPADSDNLPI